MDTSTAAIIIIAIFAVIVVAAFLVFRQRGKVEIKGPFDTGLKLDASNEQKPPAPGVKAKGVTSTGGKVDIRDETGRGAEAEDIRGKKDVTITSTPSGKEADPKV